MLSNTLKHLIARYRRFWLFRKINSVAVRYHQAYENRNYDSYRNGEIRVLNVINANVQVKTVLDIGANVGSWSLEAARNFPNAVVHSFEIVPTTFEKLVRNCRLNPQIITNAVGMSDMPGSLQVYCSVNDDQLSTCIEGVTEKFHGHDTSVVQGELTTGDIYCNKNNIDEIGFLKIDVEGMEDRVLKGFSNALNSGRIKIIQFEYGFVNVQTGFLLKDFYTLLEKHNMRIGKIYPDYVDFRDYKLGHEDFLGPNYLAVHSSLNSLIVNLSK